MKPLRFVRRCIWPLVFLGLITSAPSARAAGKVFSLSANPVRYSYDATNVVAVASGEVDVALNANGTVTVLNQNYYQPDVTNIPPGLTNVVAVAAGLSQFLALKGDGSVIAWGSGPTKSPPGLTNVVGIAAGNSFNLAVRADGTVAAWGLSDGTNVSPGLNDVIAVAAGDSHGLALKADGTVVGWGGYWEGAYQSAAASVPADLTNVVAIAANGYHDMALKADGTVVSWFVSDTIPPYVRQDLTNAVAIAAGWFHSVALKNDGTIDVWGYSYYEFSSSGLSNVVAISEYYAVLSHWPPAVLVQPASRTVFTGRECTFEAKAAGSDSLGYQWKLNGIELAGATNSTLTLSSVQLSDAGVYTLVVTNAGGAAVSESATLIAVQGSPILTSPGTNQPFIPGNQVILQAPIDGSGPMSYQWYFEGTEIQGATNSTLIISNATSSSAGAYAVAAANSFGAISSGQIRLLPALHHEFNAPAGPLIWFPTTMDATDNGSDQQVVWISPDHYQVAGWSCSTTWSLNTSSRTFEGIETCMHGTEDFYYFGFGYYSGGFHGSSIQQYGGSVPAPAWLDGHWTLDLQIEPGRDPLSGQASLTLDNGDIIPLQLTGRRLPATHELTVLLQGAGANLTAWTSDSDLKLESLMGAVHGRPIQFVANRPALFVKGTFNGLLYEITGAQQASSGFFTLTLAANGLFSGKVQLDGGAYALKGRFDSNGQAQLQVPRGKKTALILSLQMDAAGREVDGTVSDGNWTAQLFADRVFSGSASKATNYVGVYTLVIPGVTGPGQDFVGDGYASIWIEFSGLIHVSGALADGTPFTQSARVSENGQWPFYLPLYGGKGSIISWITLSNMPPSALGGNLVWFKPANPHAKFYPAGLTNQCSAFGSAFVGPIPSHGRQQLSFTSAVVTLDGGNLATPLIRLIGTTNAVAGTDRLALKWDSINGTVHGSFVHPVTKKTTSLQGILLQNEGVARGYFLGTNQSGSFVVQPAR